MSEFLIWSLTVGLFFLGLAGVFIPVLPGVALVFAGILFYAVVTGFTTIGVGFVVGSGVTAIAAWMVEYVGAAIGTKVGGGGKYSLLGTVAGGIVGLMLVGPVGLFGGIVLGAVMGAMYEGKTWGMASKAAIYTILGIIGAKLVQAGVTIILIIIFLVKVFA